MHIHEHRQPHHHHEGHHNHIHQASKNVLLLALVLVVAFAIIEGAFGYFAKSLALMSDAGHMFSDGLGLAMAAFAAWIASKPPSEQHTYGLGRAEVLGAWVSTLFILIVAVVIIVEAVRRLHNPEQVSGGTVIFVAAIGVILNLIVAYILSHGEESLNVRAAVLHVMGDLPRLICGDDQWYCNLFYTLDAY